MKFLVVLVLLFSACLPSQNVTSTVAPSHLVVIFMENKEYSSIINSPDAPYLNQFANNGRLFTKYYGVTHPSLPNYLAIASGSPQGKTGTDAILAGEIHSKNLWAQLSNNHLSWGVYMESMPSACYPGSSSGGYALKHN